MSKRERIEKIATKILTKALGSKIEQASLKKQCMFIQSTIGMAGVPAVRTRVIKGMEEECETKREAGQAPEEIVEYYWNEPAFVSLWEVLGMGKEHLEVIAKGEQDGTRV